MEYHQISVEQLQNTDIADVLLITATNIETEVLHSKIEALSNYGILKIATKKQFYYFGRFGGYNIIHCQCQNMGTQAAGSSILTASEALELWPNVKCVIMVGIAFGMYDDDERNPQHYGDVLVANKVFPYENQRLNGDGTVEYRGKHTESHQQLIDAFAIVSQKWNRQNILNESTRIEICPLLSGEKLVDDKESRDKLKKAFPEYRGGEMEGIGIASVCKNNNFPWILLKGICDFADGNKGENKKEKQKDAALAAITACSLAFETDCFRNLIGDRNTFYYRGNEIDNDKVFFIHYEEDCEPFYIPRSVDAALSPYILNKNCWVYGKSGVGKSDILARNIMINKVDYLYIDLSIIDKSDSNNAIDAIYQDLCEYAKVEPQKISNFKELIKEIARLLNERFQNSKVYLLIDEIPFHDKTLFSNFVDKICTLIKYIGRNYREVKVIFMLSSINSPLQYFANEDEIKKISQHIKFLELKEWTKEECIDLINCISRATGLKFADGYLETFIQESGFSPRLIKNILQEACVVLGVDEINANVVNKIKAQ